MIEDFTKLIVANLANVSRSATQICESRNCVGDRTTGHFCCRAHPRINVVCLILVDKCHRPQWCSYRIQEGVIHVREHINNSVADAE